MIKEVFINYVIQFGCSKGGGGVFGGVSHHQFMKDKQNMMQDDKGKSGALEMSSLKITNNSETDRKYSMLQVTKTNIFFASSQIE